MPNDNTRWWKIALCGLGILMIAGVVTYTLLTRSAAISVILPSDNPAQSSDSVNTPASDGEGELSWVTSLGSRYETDSHIFVVFPGNDELTVKADQTVKTALEKIRQSGATVDAMTLSPSDPEFQVTLERLAIQKLPAVLLLAPSRRGMVVKGDITETKILEAYLHLQRSCTPGASGCCPK